MQINYHSIQQSNLSQCRNVPNLPLSSALLRFRCLANKLFIEYISRF
uniref:Uncharacterized protein n=1 Tax=CrAss-like virus sp. ctXt06 TaxID=2825837 RepID=A0A8S5V6Y5_9CAUD|nr:MAG TPA: hypothetical protein [CrAss-like virus sp. ctXt06]